MKYLYLILLCSLFSCSDPETELGDENDIEKPEQTIREIVDEVFPEGNVFIGSACHHRLIGTESYEILNREFSYVTPANDFKQSYIHGVPGRYQYQLSDDWVQSCKDNKQVLRIHGPISPQCSQWVKEDIRTAEELETMLREYMVALCSRYNGTENILWLDVVNETIVTNPIKDPMGNYEPGDWFGPREGVENWENPWTKIGFDETHPLKPPLYVKQAFTFANQYAPNIKQIINQHGALEEVSWDKMKALVAYLRENNLRVDGLGWQAHIDWGWEKIPGNIERLGEIVRWCHSNNLEFHLTEFNVWLRKGDENKHTEQAATFKAITKAVLDNRDGGIVGINYWHIRGNDTANEDLDGCLFDDNYAPKPAYFEIKKLLKSYK